MLPKGWRLAVVLLDSVGLSWVQLDSVGHSSTWLAWLSCTCQNPGWQLLWTGTCCLMMEGRARPWKNTHTASALMHWMLYPAFMFHRPRQVRWPSPKSVGWGQTLPWERKRTSVNKWYNLWQGGRGNWRLETERTVRSGLHDRSYDFASRVAPTMDHRWGICRIKCPKPKSFLPPIPASSPCACPQLEAKGKSLILCLYRSVFWDREPGGKH